MSASSQSLDPAKLKNVHQSNGNTIAQCPACAEDGGDNKGDHLFIAADGKFGCVKFSGPEGAEHRKRIFELAGIKPERAQAGKKKSKLHATPDDCANAAKWGLENSTKTTWTETRRDAYHYKDGEVLAYIVRFDRKDGATDKNGKPEKQFRPIHKEPGGWRIGDPDGPWPLFRLHEIGAEGPVYVVEGEKTAAAGVAVGLNCTTSSYGSRSPHKTDWGPLFARVVIILPDNDASGHKYADAVASTLTGLNPPARVKVVNLPGLPPAGDLADFIKLRDDAVDVVHKLAEEAGWYEARKPGAVGAHCHCAKGQDERKVGPDGRPRLLLPCLYRPQSVFAEATGVVVGAHAGLDALYVRHNMVVEVTILQVTRDTRTLAFTALKPVRAITLLERYAEFGVIDRDDDEEPIFVPLSMGKNTAETLLCSQQFRSHLPVVERILDIPLPILRPDGTIGYPKPGYDPEFRTFLNPETPAIRPMALDAARDLMREVHAEFCFATPQAIVHAIAALLTPFCRGLYGRWNERTPVWLYTANRPRAGKDYLAALCFLLYEGRANEDAPLNSDEPETRKKITSALIAGRRRIHFANCRGHISNSAFEMIATAPMWTDRRLGENSEVTIPNELEISLSANVGLSYTPDFANRCRIILLHYEEEHANSRRFTKPDLHGWLLQNRELFLSAFAAMVTAWDQAGRPAGPGVFTSFPRWAAVVGGIMHVAGLGDPCQPNEEDAAIDGDRLTANMKTLFITGHERFGEGWVKKDSIYDLVREAQGELFGWLDLDKVGDKTKFGMQLRKYVGRILGGIRLSVDETTARSIRHTYAFKSVVEGSDPDRRSELFDAVFGGHPGHPGHPGQPKDSENTVLERDKEIDDRNIGVVDVSTVSKVYTTGPSRPDPIAEHLAAADAPIATIAAVGGALRGGDNQTHANDLEWGEAP